MKEIRAIIRPHRLEKLRNALRELADFPGLTVIKAEGFTAPSGIKKHTAAEELNDYSKKLLVCIIANDAAAPQIQQIIMEQCTTGQVGDGLVWSVDVGTASRIRDGSHPA